MATYTTLDYLPDLTYSEISNARTLTFTKSRANSVGWDNTASVFGDDSNALSHQNYRFVAKAGATYDVFSVSYFDPFLLRIYDSEGNVIVANSESDDPIGFRLSDGTYDLDVINDWVAPYSGTYYVAASWNQGSYFKFYSLSLEEDIDTIPAPEPGKVLNGGNNNDLFFGGVGNDKIDGGAGIDTFTLSGKRTGYTLQKTPTGWTVNSSTDGTDVLQNVERLKFSDTRLALDIDGNAGQSYRLYQAAFNRKPDLGGLGDWITGMDNGMPLLQVASSFIASDEFKALYGANPSTTQFVTLLYANVLHRSPETEGLSYWRGQLDNQLQSRAQVLIGFSESTENQAALIGVIGGGIEYATY